MILSILLSAMMPLQSSAAEPSYCSLRQDADSVNLISIPSKPNYFFRSFPQNELISYASDEGNFILNMKSKMQFKMPGPFDPVPLGEKVISTPDSEDGMSFYSVPEVLSGNPVPKLLHRSKYLKGVYQSVGLLEKTKNSETFAVITAGETSSVLLQKIKVSEVKGELTVEDVGSSQAFCKGVDVKLPMLSKNGQEVSGLDGETGTSKIWKLDYDSGACTEVADIGVNAGKADFSFDGNLIVFHLRGDGAKTAEYFEKAEAGMNMNIYVYNRKDKAIYQITQGRPGDNAYFPVFREDGSVVYAVIDKTGTPFFAHANPNKMKSTGVNLSEILKNPNLNQLMALGQLWNLSCADKAHQFKSVETVISVAHSLGKLKCLKLITETLDDSFQAKMSSAELEPSANGAIVFDAEVVSKLSQNDLMKVCSEL